MTSATPAALTAGVEARIAELLDARTQYTARWFPAEAGRIARLCHRLAQRFAKGGRLLAVGDPAAMRSDVRHVVVEFVHPVIVGKRALPAFGLTDALDRAAHDVALLAAPDDMLFAFGSAAELRDTVGVGRARGCLTVAFDELGAEWTFSPPSDDPFIRQELVETLYHVVWESVHVFFEHRGLLDADADAPVSDGGAASFLYPFLANAERNLDGVLADVAQSVIAKANDVTSLREATIGLDVAGPRSFASLATTARAIRAAFDAGGKVLAFGNGGSSTDAMDAVADYRSPPHGWPSRPALDLSEDPAVLTALANDIGPDSLFARQIIAHGRAGDVAMAFSTSGNSRNVIQALDEARRRRMSTVAFVGYDGGEILAKRHADHVIVSPSQYIPRIQEAQAAAYHIVRELIEHDAIRDA